MNTAFKIIPTAALLIAAALQTAPAQTTNIDEALVLNFNLNAVSQGPAVTTSAGVASDVRVSSITSRDIIVVLGAATGNTFSKKARLVVLTPTNDLESWTVQIQDGANDVDVTGFIVHNPGSSSVGSAWVTRRTGAAGDTEYSIDGFGLQDQPGFPALTEHFSVSGFTATTSRGVVNRRGQIVGQIDSIDADVSGTGDSNGQLLIIEGSVDAEGIGTQPVVTGSGISTISS
ncbi:MAG TPA: hypothetical protein VN048_06900 [Verrucomicrobiae bacterium]|nr:hypothetical protein [Verrucomicrobiae bacterium]